MNECQDGNKCHPNATCSDTDGSFTCTCRDGAAGDGFTCEGKNTLLIFDCYSPYILEGSIRNIRVHPLSIFAAQCTTNFQLVLGPVDSCLNWRVSQNLCKHTITHVFLHIRLPRALLSVLLCPFSLIQPRQSYQISRWQQSLCSTSPSVMSRKPNSPASTTRPRK